MIEPKKGERGEGKASGGVVAMEVESKPRRRRTMRVSHATAPRRRALAHQKHVPTYVRNVKTGARPLSVWRSLLTQGKYVVSVVSQLASSAPCDLECSFPKKLRPGVRNPREETRLGLIPHYSVW